MSPAPSSPARRAFDLSRYPALAPALADAIHAYRSNVFLCETDRGRTVRTLTFEDFRREAGRLAAALQRAGVTPGARVGLALGNGSRWLLGAYAALHLGAVLVPLDARLDGEGLRGLLDHAAPALLLCDLPVWQRLRRAGEPAALPPTWVTGLGEDEGPARSWEAALAAAPADAPPAAERRREDLAAIVYSSGTSGRPKGCLLTHGNYLAQAEVLANQFPLEEDDVYLSILPTNHAIDFMCGFLIPLLCGARVVHVLTLRPEWLVQACRDHGVTHMAAVPAILQALERRLRERVDALEGLPAAGMRGLIRLNAWLTRDRPRPEVSRALLRPVHQALGGRLRLIFAGGAFVPAATARSLYELGLPVVIGYGLTEACTVVAVNDLEPFRADTVGRPVAGLELRLKDRDRSGVGEVVLRGPTVFAGYLDDPQLTAEVLDAEGWLATGDLGVIDAAGHLRLVGRRKHMIVTAGGKNVYPEDVEGRFVDLPGAEEVAILAAHTIWPSLPGEDEALILVARLRPGAPAEPLLQEAALRDRRAPEHLRLGGALLVEQAFPRTTSLKVRREALAAELAARHPRQAARPLPGAERPALSGRPA